MDYTELVRSLASCPYEGPCVEFKQNNENEAMIGRTISALSNAALLEHHDMAYMIWGIDDATHEIRGTTFDPFTKKIGNEDLHNWLRQKLSNNMEFSFKDVSVDGVRVIVLTITPPTFTPTTFATIPYIRDGSHVSPLLKFPQLNKKVWDLLNSGNHENSPVKSDIDAGECLSLLDHQAMVNGFGLQEPTDKVAVMDVLCKYGFVRRQDDGMFSITMIGALLFAKDLRTFSRLSKKTIRIIQYSGTGRAGILRQMENPKGYALQFDEDIHDLKLLLPSRQVIENGLMVTKDDYPLNAVREILVNAMIHQDLLESGMYITVEIFDGRIEITNPGNMLIDVYRVVDSPSKSRNLYLPKYMREMGMCEEIGSGWDRIVEECEMMQLPAPRIEVTDSFTRVVLLGRMSYDVMSREDRLWACYMHACSQHTNGKRMTNASLRDRFGLGKESTVAMSRLLKSACEANLVKVYDDSVNPRNQSYVPFWA